MKKIILFFVIFLSAFGGCKEGEQEKNSLSCNKTSDYAYLDDYNIGSLCTDELCVVYQNIWKQLFMEKNGLTDAFFNKHIELCDSYINDWMDGTSFSIRYKVNIGWAIALNQDRFIIKITEENTYPSLDLPRNTYLTKKQVSIAVNGRAFSSDIIKLSSNETLKFSSMDKAIDFLVKKANINTLCSGMIYIDSLTGLLMLEAGAQYDNEINKCVTAHLDLINGDTEIQDTPCWID